MKVSPVWSISTQRNLAQRAYQLREVPLYSNFRVFVVFPHFCILLVLTHRSWCPDRVLPQARKYIAESMGVKYAEGVILNLEEMWHESTPRVPMVCFLSMGSDPTNSIDMLARKHELSKDTIQVTLPPFSCFDELCACSFWFSVYGARSRGSCQKAHPAMPLSGTVWLTQIAEPLYSGHFEPSYFCP